MYDLIQNVCSRNGQCISKQKKIPQKTKQNKLPIRPNLVHVTIPLAAVYICLLAMKSKEAS